MLHSTGVTTATIGRRERKKLATRRALRLAALRLAAERGVGSVTVEEISAAADVSPRTFFNYFSSKEAAIADPDPDRASDLRAALAARPVGEPPLQSLRVVLSEAAGVMAQRNEEWLLRMQVIRDTPALLPRHLAAFTAFERDLVEAVAKRTGLDPDRDCYPALVVSASVAAMRVAVNRWRASDDRTTLPDLLVSAFDQLGAGLPAPDPRKRRPRPAARISTKRLPL